MDSRHLLARFTALIATAVLVGCGSGGDDDGGTEPVGSIGVTVGNPTISVAQGATGTVAVSISRSGSFAGTVSLTLENAPTGVSGSFSPAAVANGSTTSTLTVTVTGTAATTTSTLTVRATGSGVDDKTTTFQLTVISAQTPAFTLSLSSAAINVPQGGNGTVTATIARSGGFTGAVALAVTGGTTGLTGTPNPASVPGTSTTSTITIAATATATAGTFTMTVTGTGTGVTQQQATISVTVTPVVSGSYTLTLSPTTASFQQGSNTQVTVNINRTGGFTGAVTVAAAGGPTGFTATPNPATGTTANLVTLTLAATATAATGTFTLTVTGTTPGLANQQVTMQVTITTQGSGGNATFQFCGSTTGIPLWVAAQDGNGPWTRLTLSPTNSVTFNLTTGRGGVAYVTTSGGSTTLSIFYATTAELGGGQGAPACAANPTTKTLTGSVAGLGASDQAGIAFGGSFASANFASTNFTLNNVLDGISDLLATRSATSFGGGVFTSTLTKIIIRRNLNPAAGSVLPQLDFGGSEAFDPLTRTATINNAGTDQVIFSSNYNTANASFLSLFTDVFGTGTTRTYYGVPAARQAAGDLHGLTVTAAPAGSSGLTGRVFTVYFKDAVDKTINLGPALNLATVTNTGNTPYPRLRAQNTIQPEYNKIFAITFSQAGASSRTVSIQMTGSFANGTFDTTIPDFTSVGGFDVSWALAAGVSTSWNMVGFGWTGSSIFSPTIGEGVVTQQAFRGATITP